MSPAPQVLAERAPGLRGGSALRTLGRRSVTIPCYAVLWALWLALTPLWLPAALAFDLVRGRRAPRLATTRCGLFFAFYLTCETLGLLFAFAAWLASGTWLWRGPDTPIGRRYALWNHALERAWATALLRGASRIFGFRVVIEGRDALAAGGPALLFLRHASVADTLLPAVFVAGPHGLRLRYVLKRELLWDPCLDVVGNRLANTFVDRFSEDGPREILAVQQLALGLGPSDGVVIYPEGTRFTPAKRERVLAKLRASRAPDLALRAERLGHVLPPRLGGALALLDAARGADAVFCAHTGFERAGTFWDLWNGGLVGAEIRARFWRVPYAEIPTDRERRIGWLFDHWERIDAWIARTPRSDSQRETPTG